MAFNDMTWGIDEITEPIMAEIEKTKVVNILGTISEKLNYLITQNAGGFTITASDTTQNIIVEEEKTAVYGTPTVLATFTPAVNAAIRLKAMLKVNNISARVAIRVNKGTDLVKQKIIAKKVYTEVTFDFEVVAGNQYTITLEEIDDGNSYIAYCNSLTLNYDINQPQSLLGL